MGDHRANGDLALAQATCRAIFRSACFDIPGLVRGAVWRCSLASARSDSAAAMDGLFALVSAGSETGRSQSTSGDGVVAATGRHSAIDDQQCVRYQRWHRTDCSGSPRGDSDGPRWSWQHDGTSVRACIAARLLGAFGRRVGLSAPGRSARCRYRRRRIGNGLRGNGVGGRRGQCGVTDSASRPTAHQQR